MLKSRPRKPVVLLTGFEPFGGDHFNPSGEIATRLDRTRLPTGATVRGLVLPVEGDRAFAIAAHAIRRLRPFLVVATGVSKRPGISVECQAANAAEFTIPDNGGRIIRDSRILNRGAKTITTGIDAAELAEALRSARMPADVSEDAGRFVCNWLYYRLLHLTSRAGNHARRRVVFLHLPPTPEMLKPGDTRQAFSLESVEAAVKRALELLSAKYRPQTFRTVRDSRRQPGEFR